MLDGLISNLVSGEEDAWLIITDYLKENPSRKRRFGKRIYTPRTNLKNPHPVPYAQYFILEENKSFRMFGIGFNRTFVPGDKARESANNSTQYLVGETIDIRGIRLFHFNEIEQQNFLITSPGSYYRYLGIQKFIHANKES